MRSCRVRQVISGYHHLKQKQHYFKRLLKPRRNTVLSSCCRTGGLRPQGIRPRKPWGWPVSGLIWALWADWADRFRCGNWQDSPWHLSTQALVYPFLLFLSLIFFFWSLKRQSLREIPRLQTHQDRGTQSLLGRVPLFRWEVGIPLSSQTLLTSAQSQSLPQGASFPPSNVAWNLPPLGLHVR